MQTAIATVPLEHVADANAFAGWVSLADRDRLSRVERAVELDPSNTGFKLLRASVYASVARHDEAIRDLREIKSRSEYATDLLARSCAATGDHPAARKAYLLNFLSHEKSPTAAYRLALYQAQHENPGRNLEQNVFALAAARRSCTLTNDQHVSSLMLQADFCGRLGLISCSVEVIEKLLPHLRGQQLDEARAALEVLRLELPADEDRLHALVIDGLVAIALKDAANAEASLRKADELARSLGGGSYADEIRVGLMKLRSAVERADQSAARSTRTSS